MRSRKVKLNRKKSRKRGGMMKHKLIAQGTHGKIYSVKDNPSLILKQFDNRMNHSPSLCKRIMEEINTSCQLVQYEYKLQELVHDLFLEYKSTISVPKPSHFTSTPSACQYAMERIFPLEDELLFVDMVDESSEHRMDASSKQVGYAIISQKMNIEPTELAMKIGEMFSLLHFVLNVDGYDCELILGKKGDTPTLYFIDFDKVSCFNFELPCTVQRKISEDAYEEKHLTTYKKLASFLFGSFISMSLLPTDPLLKSHFIRGYHKHMNAPPEWIEHIHAYIEDYSV